MRTTPARRSVALCRFSAVMCFLLVISLCACGTGGISSAPSSEGASLWQSSSATPRVVSSLPPASSAPSNASSLPARAPITADTLDKLKGSWFDVPSDEMVPGEKVLQYRFDEIPGEMLISAGLANTGSGVFFRGPYELTEDGTIRATVKLSAMEEPPDNPEIEVEFSIGWAGDAYDQLVITLHRPAQPTDDFRAGFGDLYGKDILYYFYY